ncbi:MAG: prenyltransferase/squalene oxidase repeat-containing protein, partial [Planctomycetota bacterium]
RAAQEYILKQQGLQGLITDRQMYSHGFATLFLAEIYGMTPTRQNKEKVRRALARAVSLLERVQLDSGGWWYEPNREYGRSDISVTICQIMALRAARNAGITVKPECIARARACVKNAYLARSGGFSYLVGPNGKPPLRSTAAFPRTAAGTCILYYLGDYDAKEVKGGVTYILARKPGGTLPGRDRFYEPFYYYGMYYATQAMYQAGGRAWEEWYPALRQDLLKRQNKSTGVWHHFRGHIRNCPQYSTAMALIALQIPYRYLPILQR